jgi:hypothetical protein
VAPSLRAMVVPHREASNCVLALEHRAGLRVEGRNNPAGSRTRVEELTIFGAVEGTKEHARCLEGWDAEYECARNQIPQT